MDKQDKIQIVVGLSLIVVGTASILVIDQISKIAAKRNAKAWSETRMQLGWESIQNMQFFRNATPEERIKYFDAYWKTEGGVKR